ncbi:MAG: hypothetical protein JW915_13935 [Chitinispirillaceae bacterium]|nr:hypothetical protein [Chitinispirillaceae bacterium]
MNNVISFSLCLFLFLNFSCFYLTDDQSKKNREIDNTAETEALARTTFIRHYGFSGNAYSVSVIETNDGGYALSGINGSKFYIVKTDCNGNLIWEKTAGTTDVKENFSSICQSYDNGYIIAGIDKNYGYVEAIKIDINGTFQWQKFYRDLESKTLVRIVATTDGGCAGIAGNTVFKLSASGNLLWGRQYDSCAYFHSIERTSDHGFIVAGTTLIKITSYGELQWIKGPDITRREVYNHAVQTNDGGYIIVGSTIIRHDNVAMQDVMEIEVLKTDSNGKPRWRKGYFPTYNYNFQYRIRETSDHKFAIAGFHDFKCTLIKIGRRGSFKWQKELDWNIFDREYYDLVTSDDGGIVVTGTGNNQAALVKFNRDGNF